MPAGSPPIPQGIYTYDERGLVKTRQVAAGHVPVWLRHRSAETTSSPTRPSHADADVRPRGAPRVALLFVQRRGAGNCYSAVYDKVGNPLQLGDPQGTDTIVYDALDRVTSVSRSHDERRRETYTYNHIGALNYNATTAIDDQRPLLTGSGTGDAAIPNTFGGQAVTVDGEGKINVARGDSDRVQPEGRAR